MYQLVLHCFAHYFHNGDVCQEKSDATVKHCCMQQQYYYHKQAMTDSEGQMFSFTTDFGLLGWLQMDAVSRDASSALKCCSRCDWEPFNGLIWFSLIR